MRITFLYMHLTRFKVILLYLLHLCIRYLYQEMDHLISEILDEIENKRKRNFNIRTDLLTLFWYSMGTSLVAMTFLLTLNLK